VLAVPTVASAAPVGAAHEDAPLRVLIIGDSVSIGSAGDWTWRYRLWKHLTAGGVAVDFVGPYDDLYDNVANRPGAQTYNDPAFDGDHAARWGLTFAFPVDDIGDLVEIYEPDVVVESLGVNDLTFLAREPDSVAGDVRSFVATARLADPEVDVVLGRQPQTWYDGVPAFNSLLDQAAAELDDEVSRVAVAALDEGFTNRAHTWDTGHPNAQGELRIAAAVADALAELGVAEPFPRPLPTVPLGPRRAPVLAAHATDGGAALRWTGPPGADRELVWMRDVSAGAPWRQLPGPVLEPFTGVHSVSGLLNGHRYAFMLQPAKGYWAAESDVRSNEQRVRPLPPRPGRVRVRSVRSPRQDLVRVVGTRGSATRYRLEIASLRTCSERRVRVTRRVTGLAQPRAAFSTRARAVRVRLVGTNLAGSGPTSAWSRCVRVR
jgi:hypothetical protein